MSATKSTAADAPDAARGLRTHRLGHAVTHTHAEKKMDEHKATAAIERVERHEHKAMSPVVAAGLDILQQNPNPETLRELLQVQKEWEANEARKAYSTALVALKRDLPTVIGRDKLVKFGNTKYTHASLGAVMEAITEPLTQHGFNLSFHPSTAKGEVSMTCRLTHAAGHSDEITVAAPVDNSGSKSAAQGVASTITLLERYTALALLGIATADMTEPAAAPDQEPDKVDASRNLNAVGWLKSVGKSREDAERFLGRKVEAWTKADRDRLRAWATPATEREPGGDDA